MFLVLLAQHILCFIEFAPRDMWCTGAVAGYASCKCTASQYLCVQRVYSSASSHGWRKRRTYLVFRFALTLNWLKKKCIYFIFIFTAPTRSHFANRVKAKRPFRLNSSEKRFVSKQTREKKIQKCDAVISRHFFAHTHAHIHFICRCRVYMDESGTSMMKLFKSSELLLAILFHILRYNKQEFK